MLACNLFQARTSTGDTDSVVTATWSALETEVASRAGGPTTEPASPPTDIVPATLPPTQEPATPTPTQTLTPSPTATSVPCDRAAFVTDVTVEDGADFGPGDNFTKTWRLQNNGSCTWTSSYDLVFQSGDAMNAPAAVQLTSGTVGPGQTVDVSVNLKAPNSPGTYKGYFRLRNGSGVIFGIGPTANVSFWVEIEVLSSLGLPDLVVNQITLDPSTPTKDDPVDVTVRIKNNGGSTNEAFTVKWWPGENYASPGMSWNVNTGLDAGEVMTLTFTYPGYPSWYPSINTKATIDTGDTVGESNEGNNTFLKNIKVDP
jgi:hypothetical protein